MDHFIRAEHKRNDRVNETLFFIYEVQLIIPNQFDQLVQGPQHPDDHRIIFSLDLILQANRLVVRPIIFSLISTLARPLIPRVKILMY